MRNGARNSAYTKAYNKNLILKIIHKEPVSRAELSRKTGLTRAAVTIIVDELVSERVIIETGAAKSEFGRKPILLDINPDAYFSGGLDISRDACSFGIVNIKGELKCRTEIDISNAGSPSEALGVIKNKISGLLSTAAINPHNFLGLGISTPGPVDVFSGRIINPPNFEMWKNFEIVSGLKKDFSFDIRLENNSVALAMAEKNFGLGKRYNNFILLTVDTGIGSGTVIGDKIYRGFGGFGGEIGHTSINFAGDQCSCGNIGCLEIYASMPAVLSKVREHDGSINSWNDILEKALAGEQYYLGIVEDEAMYLSAGIVNAINILELEAVVLTGDIKYKPALLFEKMRDIVNRHAITRDIHPVNIYVSEIVSNSDVIAAATIIFDHFFSS